MAFTAGVKRHNEVPSGCSCFNGYEGSVEAKTGAACNPSHATFACYFQLRFAHSGPAFVSKVRIQVVVAVGNHVSYRAVRRASGEWRPELRSTMSKTMQGQRGLLQIVASFGSVLLFVCSGRHAVLQVQLQGGERVSCHGQELQVSRASPVSSSERTSHDTCCQSVLIGATIALHGTTHNRFVRMNGCLADFDEAELQLSGSG